MMIKIKMRSRAIGSIAALTAFGFSAQFTHKYACQYTYGRMEYIMQNHISPNACTSARLNLYSIIRDVELQSFN